uniref:Molybdopterin biosynthesis protein n=1 Tax=Bulboplastis apyrenoidosa TaxID=1070855 RepID=A0A1Y9TMG5_9RHOD|nr:molybdopterin biosynthesis protein [Bulboplastis apyrenoidosa]ARO90846.1 molybdopterin biosynthesis protein [Bulboplastis apyrenoidosa]
MFIYNQNYPIITQELLNRYARHLSLSLVGINGQQRLGSSKVICIGAGGLASTILLYLCASGVGTIGIIDNDYVEVSNLQRQIIYNTYHINRLKVDCAKQELLKINPKCQINTYHTILSDYNSIEIIKKYDIIIDCTDNLIVRYVLTKTSLFLNKIIVYGAISQFQGQLSIFNFQGASSYKDLYPSINSINLVNNCTAEGVLGILPGIIGILQATETIKLILGIGTSMQNKILFYDALKMKFKEIYIHSQYTSMQYYKWFSKKYKKDKLFKPLFQLYSPIPIISGRLYTNLRKNYKCQIIYIGSNKMNKAFNDSYIIELTLIEIQNSLNQLKKISQEKLIILSCRTKMKALLTTLFLHRHNISSIVVDLKYISN